MPKGTGTLDTRPADHRPHRQRLRGGSRTLVRGRDGRLPQQAGPQRVSHPKRSAPTARGGGPCLDRSMVDGMREAVQDVSLVVELAGPFLRDTPQPLQALAAGLLDDDLVQAAKIAHDVKSSAQM